MGTMANFCSNCGSTVSPKSALISPSKPFDNGYSIASELQRMGVKTKIIDEVNGTFQRGEMILGEIPRLLKQKLVFTNFRVISASGILGAGRSTEWGPTGKIVIMGGNFQYLYSNLSALKQTASRIRGSHGSVQGHPVLTAGLKAIGPKISRGIWPYEYQLLDLNSIIVDRIYGVTEVQASAIAQLAEKVELKIIVEK